MKKSFFLSEEIYFANHEYIKHAVSLLPKAADVIFRESLVLGFLHAAVGHADGPQVPAHKLQAEAAGPALLDLPLAEHLRPGHAHAQGEALFD